MCCRDGQTEALPVRAPSSNRNRGRASHAAALPARCCPRHAAQKKERRRIGVHAHWACFPSPSSLQRRASSPSRQCRSPWSCSSYCPRLFQLLYLAGKQRLCQEELVLKIKDLAGWGGDRCKASRRQCVAVCHNGSKAMGMTLLGASFSRSTAERGKIFFLEKDTRPVTKDSLKKFSRENCLRSGYREPGRANSHYSFADVQSIWRGWRGSNPRPLASEANTLSTELQPRGGNGEEACRIPFF